MEATGPEAYSQEELDAAIDRLTDAGRFGEALEAGGWFGESHEAETLKAATAPDPDERISAVRTLLAEEARMGMMVGVAVGWALHEELSSPPGPGRGDTDSETEGET